MKNLHPLELILISFLTIISCSTHKVESPIEVNNIDTVYELNSRISDNDNTFNLTDEDMGVGDDGIYNFQVPVFETELLTDEETSIENIINWDVSSAFVFVFDSVKYPSFTSTFDFTHNSGKDTLFQINDIFFYNGYRKSNEIWKNYGRVKSMNLYINNVLRAVIPLLDTYKLQIIDIEKLELYCKSGEITTIKYEVTDVFHGAEYYNKIAISELKLTGIRLVY